MLLNELNDDLAVQVEFMGQNSSNANNYLLRYNQALQNKTKLTNALQMISEALTLVNVNPYASSNGYQYDTQKMENLHKGIYQLAQAIAKLNKTNSGFSRQMLDAQVQAGNQMSGMNNMSSGISHGKMHGTSWLPAPVPIMQIILVVLLVGLIIGIFGTIVSLVTGRSKEKLTLSNDNSLDNQNKSAGERG